MSTFAKYVMSVCKNDAPAPPQELVTNGDFSSGSTGWETADGWVFSGGTASYTGAAWTGNLRQFIPVEPNTQYTLTIGTLTGRCYVRNYSGYWGTDLGAALTSKTAPGTYTFTTMGTAAYICLILGNVGDANTVTFDNVSVVKSA